MNYGFLIDNDSCIGCHACSTACKSENEVPLGVQRTWVKSVETGLYPNVRRSFQVTRCNHCANPPCVRICPVTAMYQRSDGIVEFDPEICIGCKACLQACPYDAIYIDPDSGTAAKCHYCAHRVDIGLEPACVVVCPEHAILAGDLDDPTTEISRVVAEKKVTVRKPEQGTAPKLFYVGGHDVAMHPTAVERAPATFAWADVLPLEGTGAKRAGGDGRNDASNVDRNHRRRPIKAAGRQGLPETGPIMIGTGRMAEQMTQVVYNAQHRVPWHWPVPAYLVTKGIGTGLFMILSLGFGLGLVDFDAGGFLTTGFLSLVFMAATTALLVFDLERPERFLRILTRPQWKSWLTRGAFLLLGFSAVAGLWWLLELMAAAGGVDTAAVEAARGWLLWIGFPLAAGSAVYTAFLFGQAEGRDLWQSPLLPVQLLVQAFAAGGALLQLADTVAEMPGDLMAIGRVAFGLGVSANLLLMFLGEFGMPPASEAAARAGHDITHGRFARRFWAGVVLLGHLIPLGLIAVPASGGLPAEGPAALLGGLAGAAWLTGLYLYEHAFVTAPQLVPNS